MFIKTLLSTSSINAYKIYIFLSKTMLLSVGCINSETRNFKVYENKSFIESQNLERYWMIDLAKS